MSTLAESATTTTVATLNSARSATMGATITTTTAAPQPSLIDLLPAPKTFSITFSPDWSQEEDLKSPLRPASLCVVLGPENILPQQALWCFEFNVFATDELPVLPAWSKNERILQGDRALLWYEGRPSPKYKDSLVLSKCRLSANDELKTLSVAVRAPQNQDSNALIWVNRGSGLKREKGVSYLQVVKDYHYYLNITFDAGSKIEHYFKNESWCWNIYLYSKQRKFGIDEIRSSCSFENFLAHSAQNIEPNVDEGELRVDAKAWEDERHMDALDKARAKVNICDDDIRIGVTFPTATPQYSLSTSLVTAATAKTGYFSAPSVASIVKNNMAKVSAKK